MATDEQVTAKTKPPAQRRMTHSLAAFKLRTEIKLTDYNIPDIKCLHPTEVMEMCN